MTLTKESLIQSLYDQCGLSKETSRTLVETTFELMKKSLESGEDVLITGFGKFSVREKDARKGRNPATGEGLILDGRTVVTFRCSPVLRKKLKGKGFLKSKDRRKRGI
jgi:integration host factor subunit alpha